MSRRPEEKEEGEAWLMSYADLITLLLAVFVLLFSLSSIDKGKADAATEALRTYFDTKSTAQDAVGDVTLQERQLQTLRLLTVFLDLGHPDALLEKMHSSMNSDKEIERLRALAERMGLTGNATPSKPDFRFEMSFPIDSLYENNTPYLTPEGERTVRALAPSLLAAVAKGGRIIEIAGHSDAGPLRAGSPYSSNNILSAARAEAVSLVLTMEGIPNNRTRIVGKGSTEPLFPERDAKGFVDEDGMKRNRRVVISIVREDLQ